MTSNEHAGEVLRGNQANTDWKQKADEAKRAREMGKQLRAGKPASFRNSVGRHA